MGERPTLSDRTVSDSSIIRLSDPVPFDRSYWVVQGRLLAGYYPGSEDGCEADMKLKGLLDHGIRRVINLMEPDEINWERRPFAPYEARMRSIAGDMGADVAFERIPIRDGRTPTRAAMIQALDLIDESTRNNRPVYIHCWGGRGRTGTVVGCYLARHGHASGLKVLEVIRNLRKDTTDYSLPSPETAAQIDMVLSWVEAE